MYVTVWILSLSHLPGEDSQLCGSSQSDTVCLGGPGIQVSKRGITYDNCLGAPGREVSKRRITIDNCITVCLGGPARQVSKRLIDQGEFRSKHSYLLIFTNIVQFEK